MTDWQARAHELRQMADELEYWSTKAEKQGRMVLGRIADELIRLADDLKTLDEPPEDVTITTEILPVYGCEHLGNGEYQWYEAEITYENGVPVSEQILDGPFTGEWQPGCPESDPTDDN